MIDEPLFPHAHAALVFAFRFSGQSGAAPTPMAKLIRGPVATGKGLTGLDGAAQSGMIRAEVDAMAPVLRNIIVARFAFEEKERLAALLELIPHAAAQLGTGINSRRMVDALVQKFFGARVFLRDLADQLGCHANTITPKWGAIRSRFRADEDRAHDEIFHRLQRAGLLPEA
jgi:hypothetical protein